MTTSIPQQILFTLPIPAHQSPTSPSSGGKITVSRVLPPTSSSPSQAQQDIPPVYLLTHYSPPDNRLTPPFCQTYLHALLKLQYNADLYPRGLLITTSGIPKFFSNGLDLSTFQRTDLFRYVYPLWRTLLTFPMPTCALINGHCFAGGLITAMFHDYRLMNPHRGWACMNELEFDAELARGMGAIFKAKLSTATYRSLLLEARRFTALQALEAGLVDGLAGGLEEALKVMGDVDGGYGRGVAIVGKRGVGSVYGKMKESVYQDVLDALLVEDSTDAEWVERRSRGREDRESAERLLLQTLGLSGDGDGRQTKAKL